MAPARSTALSPSPSSRLAASKAILRPEVLRHGTRTLRQQETSDGQGFSWLRDASQFSAHSPGTSGARARRSSRQPGWSRGRPKGNVDTSPSMRCHFTTRLSGLANHVIQQILCNSKPCTMEFPIEGTRFFPVRVLLFGELFFLDRGHPQRAWHRGVFRESSRPLRDGRAGQESRLFQPPSSVVAGRHSRGRCPRA